MFLLLTVLALVGSIFFLFFGIKEKNYCDEKHIYGCYEDIFLVSRILAIVFAVFLVCTCFFAFNVFTSSTLDNKITMYEEENNKIEESITTAVEGYMNFEQETFENLKVDDANALFSMVPLYPELKSDELVKQQMQVYMDNSAKIKDLKEQKINIAKYRWLLYFGN